MAHSVTKTIIFPLCSVVLSFHHLVINFLLSHVAIHVLWEVLSVFLKALTADSPCFIHFRPSCWTGLFISNQGSGSSTHDIHSRTTDYQAVIRITSVNNSKIPMISSGRFQGVSGDLTMHFTLAQPFPALVHSM